MILVGVSLSWLTMEKSMEMARLLSECCVNFHMILCVYVRTYMQSCIYIFIFIRNSQRPKLLKSPQRMGLVGNAPKITSGLGK